MSQAKVIGIHHTGITVRDLDRSLAWFKQMFEFEPSVEIRDSVLADEIGEAIGVPGATLSYAFLPVGDGQIELLEYHHPSGSDFSLGNNDVGAMHVCVRVDDVPKQYEHMVAQGASFRHPPIVLTGELAGVAFAYATDPDGVQVEIWQEP
jgi:catechol 2,3-dioxygenase-like lactoylglutathione lyase family enzyme